jgi:predicted Zn-dependent protease
MDQLIVNSPNNPYLFELKGQMLFENGKLWDSIEAYEQAVKLLPNEALLLMALSQARIATNEKENIVQALKELSRSVNIDSKNITAWYLLSIAYNKIGHQGLSLLSAAEKFILLGDYKTAKNYAKRAKKALPSNSSGKLRAEDILILVE